MGQMRQCDWFNEAWRQVRSGEAGVGDKEAVP